MAPALDIFIQQLEDSGIIARGKLENFLPPRASPKDAEDLARELVRQNQLTAFQAQTILNGQSKALFLGNYTILDPLGAGGMGRVFKARHRRMERVVAIKMLALRAMDSDSAIARFDREVKAAAKLSHANIVASHDADEADGVRFLVMEFIEGTDLAALVRAQGPLPVPQAVDYIQQAARGLDYAHRQGVIHRDIKPGNLLVNREGVVKILDMGLARIHTPADGVTESDLTGAGDVMGTVDYMSPEQALDTRRVDGRSDIYSLGCTLFYLLTGGKMYDADNTIGRIIAHRERPIPSLKAARSDVPAELDEIFQRMVAKKQQDRFQTAADLLKRLAKLAPSEAGQASASETEKAIGTTDRPGRARWIPVSEPLPRNTNRKPTSVVEERSAAPATTVVSSNPRKRLAAPWAFFAASLLLVVAGTVAVQFVPFDVDWTAMNSKTTAAHDSRISTVDSPPAMSPPPPPVPTTPALDVVGARVDEPSPWRELTGHTGPVFSLAFSPDNRYLASGSSDTTIRIWDPATGATVQTLQGHTAIVYGVSFSADGKRLASAGADNSVRLWDVESGEELGHFDGHRDAVYAAALRADRDWALSGGKDQQVILWSTTTFEPLHRYAGHTRPVWAVAFARDAQHLLSAGSDNVIRVWDVESEAEVHVFRAHTAQVMALATAHDVDRIASAGFDGLIAVWEGWTSEPAMRLNGHESGVRAIDMSRDGKYLLSGGMDKRLLLWNIDARQVLFRATGHSESIAAVALSPHLKLAASAGGLLGGQDRAIRVWQLPGLD